MVSQIEETQEELNEIEEILNTREDLQELIIKACKDDSGIFVRIPYDKLGLIRQGNRENSSSRNLGKIRPVYIKEPESFFKTNQLSIEVYPRGGSEPNTEDAWNIQHPEHQCSHDLTVEDRDFVKRNKNYSSKGKVLGDKARCLFHHDNKCTNCPKENEIAFRYNRCELHNGFDCCGMFKEGWLNKQGVRVRKVFVLKYGSFCSFEDDKYLKNEVGIREQG